VPARFEFASLPQPLAGRLGTPSVKPSAPELAAHPKERYVSVAPTHQTYQYREADSLEEVNRLAAEEGFDLFQAVALEGRMHFVLRRVRDSELGRRVGFSGSGPRAPIS